MAVVSVDGARLFERHVQAIWYDAALRPTPLHTRNGTEVRVVSPGTWNLGPGPDFHNAVLELGRSRRRLTGDVEVHMHPSDWDAHGHGGDPRYRGVVAHVTWNGGPIPKSLPSDAVSIWIGRFVVSNPRFSPLSIDLAAYPYSRQPDGERPCEAALGCNPDRAVAMLAEAGERRLRRKARQVAERLGTGVDAHQLFYEETMCALGYSRNSAGFRRVARRLPIRELPRDVAAARAAMLVVGGFEDWDRAGQRPCNAPEVRLSHAAEMFTETPFMDFARCADFTRRSVSAMARSMCAGGCLGRGRAAAVIANVVVPFALASGNISAVPEWLPPEDVSGPVRLMAFRLFGRDHSPTAMYAGNGLLVQGLLQVFGEMCLPRHPDCGPCPLGSAGPRLPHGAQTFAPAPAKTLV